MSLKSVVLGVGASSWRVPPGVSFGWINAAAGGGGGQGDTEGAAGGSGGGAGEFCLGMPVPLTPGTIMTFGPGTGSVGGTGGTPSTAPNPTTFAGFSVLGGGSLANANGTLSSGAGGGPRGGAALTIPSQDGFAGTAESPTAYGGASGGTGENASVTGGGAGGQQIGEFASPRTANTSQHPSGGGGCGVFGAGGLGTSDSTANGGSGAGYGTGSAGVAGNAGGTKFAGNGAGGVVMIFYIAP